MKLEDVKFKVMTQTFERNDLLVACAEKTGLELVEKEMGYHNARYLYTFDSCTLKKRMLSASKSMDGFTEGLVCKDLPEMTLPQVIELLSKVEKPKKVFDIKPFDRVLVRLSNDTYWRLELFERSSDSKEGFLCMTSEWEFLLPYKDNKHLLGKTDAPEGWWECENGEPVWKREG